MIFNEAKKVIKNANSTTFIVLHLQGSQALSITKATQANLKNLPQRATPPS
ncbi:hypothetical protein [Campylobacter concisus]